MTTWVIVVAAGSGARFGAPKQLALLDGRELWRHSLEAFHEAGLSSITTVGPVGGGVPGGATRRESVAAGLELVPSGVTRVLVHDAARPLVTPDLIRRVLRRLEAGDVAGVIPVVPLRDTVKRVDGETVTETLERAELVAVQTPQGFQADWLRRAHATFEGDPTDDASMVEAIGGKVVAVPGDDSNLKITYPADLAIAETIMTRRNEQVSR